MKNLALAGLVIVVIVLVARLTTNGSRDEPARSTMPSTTETEPLALISASCDTSSLGGSTYGLRCKGFVKNISSQPQRDVWMRIITIDKDGRPIASEQGMVESNPVLPGETAPFGVDRFVAPNDLPAKWKVEFYRFLGGTIPYRDDRPNH